MCNLFHTIAGDNTNIIEHLTRMKVYWERLSMIGVDEIRLSDFIFKILISSSLLPSWDMFTKTDVGGILGIKDTSPKKTLHSQHFIGILKEEYRHRENCKNHNKVTNIVTNNNSLANRMSHPKVPRQQSNATCGQCGKKGHKTQNCIYLGKSKCTKCNKFHAAQKCDTCDKYGHCTKDCWKNSKNKHKHSNQSSSGGSANKVRKQESASIAVIEEQTNIAIAKSQMMFNVQDLEATLLSRMGGMGEEKQSMNYESDTYIYEIVQ
jgi:hypothetical protein